MKKEYLFFILFLVGAFVVGGHLEAGVLVCGQDALPAEPETVREEAWASSPQELVEVTQVLEIEVISLTGDVEVKAAGQEVFRPAREGALLESGAVLRTGSDSYAELGFDEEDQKVVRVEEKTTAVLLLKEDEKVELLEGEVFSIIRNLPAGAAFEIRTPTAVAGARGTQWVTRYREETTDVEAIDDVPYVKSFDAQGRVMGEAVAVVPGFRRSVRRFQPPAAAQRIPEAQLEHWNRTRQGLAERVRDVRQKRGMPKRDPQKLRRVTTKARQADLDVQRLKDHAEKPRQDAGRSDIRQDAGRRDIRQDVGRRDIEDHAPRQDRRPLKDRIEKGDSWREGMRDHLDKAAQSDRRPDEKEKSPLKPGDGEIGKGPRKERDRQEGEAGSLKKEADESDKGRRQRLEDLQRGRLKRPEKDAAAKTRSRQDVVRKQPQGAASPLSRVKR